MKILSIQEAYTKKFERQKKIKQLKYHAAGHCVHIGKISPGCNQCFLPINSLNILSGGKCNIDCPYCPSDKGIEGLSKKEIRKMKLQILRSTCRPDFYISKISFSGGGEPLMYLNIITDFMKFFRNNVERYIKKKPWYYLYTNGILADKDMLLRLRELGFDEIRFHPGASNFSKKVYNHIEKAVPIFKAVSVETPTWPPHRKKLFEMLPIIASLGVKHLNLGEIEVNRFNYNRLTRILPRGKIYQCFEMHLYDEGLTYDIIEEVLKKKYNYSVLDCSCFVKNIQRSPAKWAVHEAVRGLCAEY